MFDILKYGHPNSLAFKPTVDVSFIKHEALFFSVFVE